MKNIVIFASGSGSNAQNIIEFFRKDGSASVEAVFCNNPKAGVIKRCEDLDVPCVVFDRDEFYNTRKIVDLIEAFDADLVVLAGFLWLVPANLIEAFPNRILNIHPALLPKYGGKGMYGMNVHIAVIEAGEEESGITIHTVDAEYDKGEIVLQAVTRVDANDTPETLAKKIHELEYKHFPLAIKKYLEKL